MRAGWGDREKTSIYPGYFLHGYKKNIPQKVYNSTVLNSWWYPDSIDSLPFF